MLTPQALYDLFEVLGTPAPGRRLVERARREAPVREVQSNRSNVITRFASQKMGRAIAAESRTCEFPAIVQYERDPKVLEYYPQPVKLDLILTDGGTRTPIRLPHTPDFLLITESGFRLEEWREEERLLRLAQKAPGRYLRTEAGWRFPELEAQLAEMGIEYRLRSAEEHPRQYVQNLVFLGDYLTSGVPQVEPAVLASLQAQFEEEPVLPLLHLLERASDRKKLQEGYLVLDEESGTRRTHLATSEDIYKAIADGQLVVDLQQEDLSETDRVWVYRDEASLQFHNRVEGAASGRKAESRVASIEVGATLTYEGRPYTIALVGESKAILTGTGSATCEVAISVLEGLHARGQLDLRAVMSEGVSVGEALKSVSPLALKTAMTRREWLDLAKVDRNAVPVSDRTLARYRKAMREAGDSAVGQHLALATKYDRCGDRKRKIPQALIDLIDQVAREAFNTPRCISKKAAYHYLLQACHQADLKPCSYKTFTKELENRKSVRARMGKRWAYQTDPIAWHLHHQEAIHGVRPFQLVHIDHTELDLLLCLPGRKESLGRAWLTLAADAESRAILGFYLSFESPSYRSCMMLLRDIVRRHGRMPEMLVLDNGKEFHSRALQRVCQLYGCSIRYRPAGHARAGSVLERLFGTVNTQFIHLLEGNTQLMKHVRMTTKSVMPENFTAWTLPALHGALEYYCTRIYGTETHPAHGEAPLEYLARRLRETGERRNRLVRFDDVFRIETCPSPREGDTRLVDLHRGVKINHIWYACEAFKRGGLDGKPVEVRIDPWDVRVAYALVDGQWHRCVSKLNGLLRNRTEVELRYAYEEILRKFGAKKKELSPERVAEHLRVLDAKAFDPRLTSQQAEAKTVYEPLGMAQAIAEPKRHAHAAPSDLASKASSSDLVPLKSEAHPIPKANKPVKAGNNGRAGSSEPPPNQALSVTTAPNPTENVDEYALF